jgi:hypothetical protein
MTQVRIWALQEEAQLIGSDAVEQQWRFRGPSRPVVADAHLGARCAFQVILTENNTFSLRKVGPVNAEMKERRRNDVQSSGETRSHGTEPRTITGRGDFM